MIYDKDYHLVAKPFKPDTRRKVYGISTCSAGNSMHDPSVEGDLGVLFETRERAEAYLKSYPQSEYTTYTIYCQRIGLPDDT